MAAEDELKDIKSILGQIRDQNQTTAGVGSQSSRDLAQYTSELKMARQELDLLDKGSGAYNRKLRDVEKLTSQARNAMKDQRRETDLLTLSMQGVSGAMDMLGNAVDKVIVKFGELISSVMAEAKELDALTVQFRAATGASSQMAGNIGALTDRLRLFGVSSQESADAIGALYGGFNMFTQLNQDQQQQLGATVAILGELGISAQTSSKILETSMMAMGMSVDQSTSLLMDLRGTAQALQIPIEQLSQDFLTAENRIVQLGERGPDAFKKLSAQSKATGVDVGTLIGVVEQFDTFESAAKAAAQLGAVLGTSVLDPLAMMQMESPADQVEYLRDSLLNAGVTADNFSEQNRFMQKAIAKAMNTDTTTAVKILRGEFDELNDAAQEATMTFEEMRKEAFGLKGFDEVVNNMMGSLKRPISDIQKATRATFEGLTPLISKFEKFNADLITQTSSFVEKNSQLVGAVGILYNMANIDGVQKGYEIFKGIAGFTGNVMSNLFSIKGVLAVMVAGSIYLLREKIGEIYDIFQNKGPVEAIKAIGAALTSVFNEYKQKAIDMGFDKTFFNALKTKFKTAAITTYHTFRDEFLKPMFRTLQVELIYQFEQMKANGTFAKIGNMIVDVLKTATRKAISASLFALEEGLDAIPGVSTILTPFRAMLRGAGSLAAPEESGPARSRAEIRKDLSKMTPEERKQALASRQGVIQARIDDKVASLQLQNTKGMQTVNAKTAQVLAKASEKIATVTPHIDNLQRQISATIDSTTKMAEKGFAEGVKIGKEMQASSAAQHNQVFNVDLHLDKQKFASAVAGPANRAIGQKIIGRGSN